MPNDKDAPTRQGSRLAIDSDSGDEISGDALTRSGGDGSGLVICAKKSREMLWEGSFAEAEAIEHVFDGLSDIEDAKDRAHGYATLEVSPSLIRVRRHLSSEEYDRRFQAKPVARRPITHWSAKSRASMTSRLATLDYSQMEWSPDRPPALITLTYPGLWEEVVPNAKIAKRHLRTFRKRYERRFGDLRALWKLEFQRRGAPHFHIFCVPPKTGSSEEGGFRQWLSATWTDIVQPPDATEKAKHLQAGTGLDFAFGFRSTNEFQIATYFAKHNSSAFGWKDYQHEPPALWLETGSVGRFWGYWGLTPLIATASLSVEESLFVVRTLRRWARANQRPVRVRVWRTKRDTGEMYRRTATRRRRRFQRSSGFIVMENSLSIIGQLVEVIERDHRSSNAIGGRNETVGSDSIPRGKKR